MRSMLRPILLVLLFAVGSSAWAEMRTVSLSELGPSREQQQAALIITKVIDRYHYKKAPLDDALSKQILTRYIETLDPSRMFFLETDINSFRRSEYRFDDYLRSAQLEPAFEIFRVYRDRVTERTQAALRLVDAKLDFAREESYLLDREEAPWAKNKAELDDLWRMRIKNDILSLRLAGKQEDAIKKTLRERYESLDRRVHQFDASDIFQSFVNAFTLSLEPHTSYMSPSTSENFDISMRLSLEGIGAVLRQDNEYTVVQEVVTGGPAKLSGSLHVGDRVIGVGQGLNGKMEDVVGWRLQDVVEKIRGPKGSVVRLQVLPKQEGPDGPNLEVSLVRNKIKLDSRAAKASVIEGLDDMGPGKIGVIEIPTFYRDFRAESEGDEGFRSTTRDVRALIDDLKSKGVDGIVVDLRENGGGSLSEATELTGLFIDKGPVVQVKDAFGDVEVERDEDPGVAYDGPLAVLVDRNSASASEIFAGAIQDYHRGIIIGEPTFGKGTVQTLIDLNRFVAAGSPDLGRLRLTMAQFFRVNGGSTQHKGVVPDIVYPTASQSDKQGERGLENALPWAEIEPAKYSPFGLGSLERLRALSNNRIAKDLGFKLLVEEEHLLEDAEKKTKVSLVEAERKAEWNSKEKVRKDYENRFRASLGLPALTEDKAAEDDEDQTDKEDEVVSKIMLNEAARVLADFVATLESEGKLRAAMR